MASVGQARTQHPYDCLAVPHEKKVILERISRRQVNHRYQGTCVASSMLKENLDWPWRGVNIHLKRLLHLHGTAMGIPALTRHKIL